MSHLILLCGSSLLFISYLFLNMIKIATSDRVISAELVCTDRDMQLHVLLERPLTHAARAFVKERSNDVHCSHVYPTNTDHNALMFRVPLSTCGMIRTQQQTNRFSFSTTVVISFHRMFVSHSDRAYRLSCDYMKNAPAAEKAVTAAVGVRSPEETPMSDAGDATAECSYTLRGGGTDGGDDAVLQMVTIGEQIRHKWDCPNLHPDQFIFVHSCIVNPEFPSPADPMIVDRNGCPVDAMVMGPIVYSSDGRRASATHRAYKFADYPNLLFKCSISICRRSLFGSPCLNDNGNTVTIPPKCIKSRTERSLNHEEDNNNATSATVSGNSSSQSEDPTQIRLSDSITVTELRPADLSPSSYDGPKFCISLPIFLIPVVFSLISLLALIVLAVRQQRQTRTQ